MKKRVAGIAAGIGMLVTAMWTPQGATAQDVQGQGTAARQGPARGVAAREGPVRGAVVRERRSLVWGPCRDGRGRSAQVVPGRPAVRVECATLRVPLDHHDPSRTIGIALNRIRGNASRDRLGALLVNPGGPGASGRDLAKGVVAGLPVGLAARFDVIGFDPRGVGASDPALTCVDPRTHYRAPRPDQVPDGRRDEAVLIARARGYAEACGTRWSWMLPHMTTENSARDMDLIREALGESKISYLGYSYGSYLGAVYATLFPDRLKRLVLDSVVDPRGVWYRSNLDQSVAFEARHVDFLRWVARHDAVYRLGSTERAVSSAWYAMRDRLAGHPARGVVGPSELDDLYTLGGYSDILWPQLAKAFSAYARRREPAPLLNAYRKHGENDAKDENSYAVYLAVECRDAAWPRDWTRWRADMTRANARAPFLTWPNAWYNAPCAFWPEPGGTPVEVRGSDALPPVLLIQGERDAATPYEGALRMRDLMPTSRLLVVPGGNHGVAFSGNACVDRRLAAYLRDGTPPAGARRGGRAPDARCPGVPAPVPAAAPAPVRVPAGHAVRGSALSSR
ncbi:alpha/beta hydrolase [Streptosporangium sp. DT93]|uniref:alpha/beta hydrolase n=1 Tax=Streptosporangium sp. DT93 TaxID=3393428 RepID=UPI003CFAEC36